jgi:Domain of unknown function (DUF4190)
LFQCCTPLFSTLGLIFSCAALAQINRNAAQRGRSLAIAGIILAILGYLVFLGLLSTGFIRHGFSGRRFI